MNIDSVWKVDYDDEGNEIESQFPLSEIKKGDRIRIRTGAIIPVDGKIAEGDAMGAVVFLSKDQKMGEVEGKLAQTAAGFLGKQMEQ